MTVEKSLRSPKERGTIFGSAFPCETCFFRSTRPALTTKSTWRVIYNIISRDINCRYDGTRFVLKEYLDMMYFIQQGNKMERFTIVEQRLKEWRKADYGTIGGGFIVSIIIKLLFGISLVMPS